MNVLIFVMGVVAGFYTGMLVMALCIAADDRRYQ